MPSNEYIVTIRLDHDLAEQIGSEVKHATTVAACDVARASVVRSLLRRGVEATRADRAVRPVTP